MSWSFETRFKDYIKYAYIIFQPFQLRTVTAVTPLSVALFCGPLRLPFDSDSANGGESSDSECEEQRNPHLSARNPLKLDEWITFNLLDEVVGIDWILLSHNNVLLIQM